MFTTQAIELTQRGQDRVEQNHPAFALIGAHRVSGSANLFGSDFKHRTFIEISLSEASTERHLSTDWPHAKKEIVKVMLSEAQWATFVSSMNIGRGTPCTLDILHGAYVPRLPDPEDRQRTFSQEMRQTQVDAIDSLKKLAAALETTSLSAAKRKELVGLVDGAIRELGPNTDFVTKQFGEHMEAVTERAKIEVNAYAQQAMSGLVHLGSEAGLAPIELSGA
ncbi:hypothetical protein ABIC83_002883 [Roseateles asaccharophilus]|uniref:hypothetical protein n=1 Tax=Roseateles asaccharophilus TaxID=582607 RepID=UPI003837827B